MSNKKKNPAESKGRQVSQTKNSNSQHAQKNYEKAVEKKRGIPDSSGSHPITQTPKYDLTNSQNIQDAQKDYLRQVNEQRGIANNPQLNSPKNSEPVYVSNINRSRDVDGKIVKRGIDMSELYEKSARGGAADSEFAKAYGASESDIRSLMETRDISGSRGVKYKISDTMSNGVNTIVHYVYESGTSGTDFGQGVREVRNWVYPVAFVISDQIMMSASRTLQKDLAYRLERLSAKYNVFGSDFTYIGRPELGLNKKELLEIQRELCKKLSSSGFKGTPGNSKVLFNLTNKFLKENKARLLDSEKGAVLMLKEISRCNMMNSITARRRRRFRGSMRMRAFRYLQQCDAGQGMVITFTIYLRMYQTLKMGLRAAKKMGWAVQKASLLALKATTTAAAAFAKTKLAQKLAQTQLGGAANRGAKAAQRGARSIKERMTNLQAGARKTRLGKKLEGARSFLRDPFGLKKNKVLIIKRLGNTRVGKFVSKIFSPFRAVKLAFSKLLGALIAGISALLSILMMVVLVFIVAFLIIIVVISLFMSVIAMFDLAESDENKIKDGLVYIRELSEEQNEYLQSLNGRYRNVNISYESVKDDESYSDPDNQPDMPIVETTNSAEIMSMAQVYFDFDLENVDTGRMKDYIKKIYDSSHLVTITEYQETYIDGNGKEKTVTDATVMFRTYYFNHLFDCKLSSSGGVGVVAGSEITEQVWNYLRTAGVGAEQTAGIMGNMYCESGFDPGIVEYGNGIGFGLCQWSYGRRENLENFAASQGKSPSDLKVQLDFFMTEYNPGAFIGHYDEFMTATSPEEAAYHFLWGWERPAEWAGNATLPTRQAAARTYYDTYIDRELVTDKEK